MPAWTSTSTSTAEHCSCAAWGRPYLLAGAVTPRWSRIGRTPSAKW